MPTLIKARSGDWVMPDLHCPVCQHYAWSLETMRPVLLNGQPHHPSCPFIRNARIANRTGFGGHVPLSVVLRSGLLIGTAAKVLGASLPGAAVMGFAAALSEAGSGDIPWGWRRWVLGLFSKPEH